MQRRKFIAGAGSLAAAGIGGAVLISGSAVAKVGEHQFVGTRIEGESDDGSLDDVRGGAHSITFSYEGFNDPADEATVELQVVHSGTVETIDSATRDDISGTSQSHVALSQKLEGSVLDHPNLDATDFEADSDGSTNTSDVRLRLKVTLTSVAGDEATGDRDANLRVVMNNIDSDADVGGEADGEVVTDFETIATNPDGWMTLLADWGDETRFRIELDAEVYGGWPDNEDEYFQEVVVDYGADESPSDEYRFGFHGPGGVDDTDISEGYIKANFGEGDWQDGEADFEIYDGDDVTGFNGEESGDQHSYTFTVDWNALDELDEGTRGDLSSPGRPNELRLEAFGGDGGNGRSGSTGKVFHRVD